VWGGAALVPGEKGDDQMHYDAVLIGSIVSVAIAVVIVVFLGFKIRQLMKRDAEAHRTGQK